MSKGARPALSERELEVKALLDDGFTAHDVALLLMIAESTARTHVANIEEKLRQT